MLVLFLSVAAGNHSANAGGVTVITHGAELFGAGYPSWVDEMAIAVTNAAAAKGYPSSWYHVTIYGDIFVGFQDAISRRSTTAATNTEEVVVTVDWSSLADHSQVFIGAHITTADIARFLAGRLLKADLAWGIASPLATGPLHLIGHSRGGSVELETAKILGSHGIWVDHVTTLDPHPLNSGDTGVKAPPGFHQGDPVALLYENVIFADNYWRSDFSPLDFDGEPIPGSAEVHLSESILCGEGYTYEHSDVHAWYHGTIGLGGTFPTSDGDGDGAVTIPDSWYVLPHPARNLSGFFYSRIANGSLLYRPAFSYAVGTKFGGRHVRETSSRDGGSQWANIGIIHTPGYPDDKFTQGSNLVATYKYQDRDSGVRIEWYLDIDTNPFNNTGNPVAAQTLESTGDKAVNGTVSISTAGFTTGTPRYLLAKITSLNNNAVRYDYADNQFTVTSPTFALNTISPTVIAPGAGVASLTLSGTGFGGGNIYKVAFDNGTTFNEVTPTSVTTTQMLANFNFGSTPRTWKVFVRSFYPPGTLAGQTEPLLLEPV